MQPVREVKLEETEERNSVQQDEVCVKWGWKSEKSEICFSNEGGKTKHDSPVNHSQISGFEASHG